MFTYLLVNIATLLFPLLLSFERKMAWHRQWRFVLPPLLLTAAVFIAWDAWFTHLGVWGFTPRYLTGLSLLGLPIEEMLFFITVPFACMFISGVVRHYLGNRKLPKFGPAVTVALLLISGFVIAWKAGHLYTNFAFGFAALWLILAQWVIRKGSMEEFYLSYLIHLIPFLIVNGILTALPVVWYDDTENLGIRIGSIPADDLAYSLGLFLMNHSLAAWLEARSAAPKWRTSP
jgi:lycopene cyclase domain-containing protein